MKTVAKQIPKQSIALGWESALKRRPTLRKVVENISWLTADKIVRMGAGLLVGVWVARYLGPGSFGELNYSIAFVALLGTLASVGLQQIVVREIVLEPSKADEILGSALALQVISGLISWLALCTILWPSRSDPESSSTLTMVISLTLLLRPFDVLRYWFESQVLSKYVVIVENATFIVASSVRVLLILRSATVIAFAWVVAAEAAVAAVGILGVYLSKGIPKFQHWAASRARAKQLLFASWPLAFSSLAVMVYMRIDQLMLKYMLSNEAVGIYTAAVRVSEVWYFVPTTVVASTFPAILQTRKTDYSLYLTRLQRLYDVLCLLAVVMAIVMTFASGKVIQVLYGQTFMAAAGILSIHVWTGVFVFLGVVSANWFVAEGLQTILLYRTVAGALANIGLNLLLIPRLGAIGAAVATVISQMLASVVLNATTRNSRVAFKMQCRSLVLAGVPAELGRLAKGMGLSLWT